MSNVLDFNNYRKREPEKVFCCSECYNQTFEFKWDNEENKPNLHCTRCRFIVLGVDIETEKGD